MTDQTKEKTTAGVALPDSLTWLELVRGSTCYTNVKATSPVHHVFVQDFLNKQWYVATDGRVMVLVEVKPSDGTFESENLLKTTPPRPPFLPRLMLLGEKREANECPTSEVVSHRLLFEKLAAFVAVLRLDELDEHQEVDTVPVVYRRIGGRIVDVCYLVRPLAMLASIRVSIEARGAGEPLLFAGRTLDEARDWRVLLMPVKEYEGNRTSYRGEHFEFPTPKSSPRKLSGEK